MVSRKCYHAVTIVAWIPAYAGMTSVGVELTSVGMEMTLESGVVSSDSQWQLYRIATTVITAWR
ncbi:MAG: hypothetical protein ACO2ZM_01860 [Francisellaceae bacterium]